MALAAHKLCAWCSAPTAHTDDEGDPSCAPGEGCAAPKRRAPVTSTNLRPEAHALAAPAPAPVYRVAWPRAAARRCVTPWCGRTCAGTSTRCARCQRAERGAA